MPNYQEDSYDCTPVSCLATSWVLDELAGFGSYTYVYIIFVPFPTKHDICTRIYRAFSSSIAVPAQNSNISYSTFRTGLQQGDKDVETMRAGLPDRGLWFAGEHTAPLSALGTVNGAYMSGERVGTVIAGAYGISIDTIR